MDRPWFRRRRFLINLPYQLGNALTVFLLVLLYTLVLGFLIFYPLEQEFMAAARFEEQARLARIVLEFHKRLWPGVFIVALLAGLQAILASHRIVGPLDKVQKALQALIAGDYSHRIRLRRWDKFREFEALVNELGERLEALARRDQELHTRLRDQLRSLETLLEQDRSLGKEAQELMAQMLRELEVIPDRPGG